MGWSELSLVKLAKNSLRFLGRRCLSLADRFFLLLPPPSPREPVHTTRLDDARVLPLPPPSPRESVHTAWLEAKGDRTLRLDYTLKADDIVVDVGGFEGQWASDIFARCLCRIHIFEPVPTFADFIARRFAANPSIHLHRFALSASDGVLDFSVQGDASSAATSGNTWIQVPVRGFESWLCESGISEIALMKVNIEGGEYDLLEHLISTGLVTQVRNLQVQFHDFVPDAEARMASIQATLQCTHRLTWQYPFVWENWARLENGP